MQTCVHEKDRQHATMRPMPRIMQACVHNKDILPTQHCATPEQMHKQPSGHPMHTCSDRSPCLPARSDFSSDEGKTAVCGWSQGSTHEGPRARLAGGPAATAGALASATVRAFSRALALAFPLAAALPEDGGTAAASTTRASAADEGATAAAAEADEDATAGASTTTASAGPAAAAGDADEPDAPRTPASCATDSGTRKAAAARLTAAMVGRDQVSVAKASAKAAANM